MTSKSRGVIRLTKHQWYALGGFKNTSLYRKQRADGAWAYYQDTGILP